MSDNMFHIVMTCMVAAIVIIGAGAVGFGVWKSHKNMMLKYQAIERSISVVDCALNKRCE
jgi:hypothetical protein